MTQIQEYTSGACPINPIILRRSETLVVPSSSSVSTVSLIRLSSRGVKPVRQSHLPRLARVPLIRLPYINPIVLMRSETGVKPDDYDHRVVGDVPLIRFP